MPSLESIDAEVMSENLAKVIPFPVQPNTEFSAELSFPPALPYTRNFFPLPAEQYVEFAWVQKIRRLGNHLLDFALEKSVETFEAYDRMRGHRGRLL
jgi:hypothetical protein